MWLKGNLHTHTTRSDGDATPDYVTQWYRDFGYDFVVLTDHQVRTSLEHLEKAPDGLIVIPGVELSGFAGDKPIHLCALGASGEPEPDQKWQARTAAEALQGMIDWALGHDAVPVASHPNFHYAWGAEDIAATRGCTLIEIYNGHGSCNFYAAGGMPSNEDVWQQLLCAGRRFFGVAVDDVHHFHKPWVGYRVAPPAKGWVVVDAAERSAEAILQALREGRFYSSTEIELAHYAVDGTRIVASIDAYHMLRYSIELIGPDGTVLHEVPDTEATIDISSAPRPCRLRMRSSHGGFAWCQPIW